MRASFALYVLCEGRIPGAILAEVGSCRGAGRMAFGTTEGSGRDFGLCERDLGTLQGGRGVLVELFRGRFCEEEETRGSGCWAMREWGGVAVCGGRERENGKNCLLLWKQIV